MRPRATALGNVAMMIRPTNSTQGFNEAESNCSRKCENHRDGDYQRAASMRPRATALGNVAPELPSPLWCTASMRPRATALGNFDAHLRTWSSPIGFNEAESNCSRKFQALVDIGAALPASMRPRATALGNAN